jgi:hypothetical protein
MTDRAVQPEAPTRCNRCGELVYCEGIDGQEHAVARAASQERPHPCADCAEDAFTGSGRGICAYHEAAAQERPQPPLHGHQVSGDWYECTDEHPGVAQERPSIDAQTADLIDALAAHGVFSRLDFEMFVERLRHARLAGGSVASPEPRE